MCISAASLSIVLQKRVILCCPAPHHVPNCFPMDEDEPGDAPNEHFELDVSDADDLGNMDEIFSSEEPDQGSLNQTAHEHEEELLIGSAKQSDAQSEASGILEHSASDQAEDPGLYEQFAASIGPKPETLLDHDFLENTNDFEDPELDEEFVKRISELLEGIARDPLDYEAHVELISLYRKAELYDDLRSARQTMHAFHPLSESLWLQWLNDEISGALLTEDKIAVAHLYEQATTDYLSFRLWKDFSEFYISQYKASMEDDEDYEMKSFFSANKVIEVLQAAVEATKYVLPSSHAIWKIYRDFLQSRLEVDQSESVFVLLKRAYETHIATPHSSIESTWEDYSSFVSSYDSTNYEATMMSATVTYQAAKAKFEAREIFELQLTRENILEYLQWECAQQPLDIELLICLYERSIIVYPLTSSLWLEYILMLFEKQRSVLQIIERAVRNCPEAGLLWACYFRFLEMDERPVEEMLQIQERALNSRLNKHFHELVEVHCAWYEALWRKYNASDMARTEQLASSLISTCDEIESITQSLWRAFKTTDPQYRLDRLCLNFKTFCEDLDGARRIWKRLSKRHHREANFWLQFFTWERNYGTIDNARKILLGMSYRELDYPEILYDSLLSFELESGNAKSFQVAFAKVHQAGNVEKRSRTLTNRMEAESSIADHNHYHDGIEKRKLDASEKMVNKKAKIENLDGVTTLPDIGRDRENASVKVQYLPLTTTEKRLRQIFRDCGSVQSVKLFVQEESQTAIIEFNDTSDVSVAMTRDKRIVDGAEIQVSKAEALRLFVTNFAPTADETSMYALFGKYGDVVAVDFPSLKYDKKRRFCYIGLKSTEQSYAALELDGTVVNGHEIKVHISDPRNRAARSGAIYEGRQVMATNLPFKATEDDIKPHFESHGEVTNVSLSKNPDGTLKGFGFITFATRQAAEAALTLDGTKFGGRALGVKIADANVKSKKPIAHRTVNPAISATSTETDRPTHEQMVQKTVCAINVADTVNEARIRQLFEPFGSLRKVELRPDHSGVFVEYDSVANAGKATLALEGRELSGQKLHFVSFGEVMSKAPSSVKATGGAEDKTSIGNGRFMPPQVNRLARRKALGISGTPHKK